MMISCCHLKRNENTYLAGVHLVDGNDQLSYTEGERQQGVLSGLTVLGDTSLELSDTGSDDQDGAISLGSTSDHVLDEISVTGSIDDGNVVPGSLELPQGDVDGDTSLSLGLELVQYPCVLEGGLAQFSGFLLELFNGSLVDTSTLVDQVTGGGRFTGIDVTDNDNVDVNLLFTLMTR
jgi:hypothetical protein